MNLGERKDNQEEVEEEEPPGRLKEAGTIHLEADQ